jgi:hypothetical protein
MPTRNVSGFAFHIPKQMAGAIWDGLVHSRAQGLSRLYVKTTVFIRGQFPAR